MELVVSLCSLSLTRKQNLLPLLAMMSVLAYAWFVNGRYQAFVSDDGIGFATFMFGIVGFAVGAADGIQIDHKKNLAGAQTACLFVSLISTYTAISLGALVAIIVGGAIAHAIFLWSQAHGFLPYIGIALTLFTGVMIKLCLGKVSRAS